MREIGGINREHEFRRSTRWTQPGPAIIPPGMPAGPDRRLRQRSLPALIAAAREALAGAMWNSLPPTSAIRTSAQPPQGHAVDSSPTSPGAEALA
jgi:hypothetical protein